MNIRDPRFLIAVASAGAVLTFGVVDMQRVSPGEVTVVHGRVDQIDGGMDCNACHGGWGSDMTSACLDCHEPIQLQVANVSGLHGQLDSAQGGRCALCHSEHHGAEFNIVNALSFSLAGVPDVNEFDHDMIGFPMDGVHLEQSCTECHEHASTVPLPEGALRFLGLDQSCASCHEDPHEVLLSQSCTDCHGQQAFEDVHALEHDQYLGLVGAHGELDCRTCHEQQSTYSLEALANPRHELTARECADCHDSPHEPRFTRRVARLERVAEARSCRACHFEEHLSFALPEDAMPQGLHAASGFPLQAPHAKLDCAVCHDPELADFAERYPGRENKDCAACHADPHAGQFENAMLGPSACVDCHAATHFEPHEFDSVAHARTSLPLEFAHAEAQCDACHQPMEGGHATLFRGSQARCEACHGDAHVGAFDAFAEDLAAIGEGSCARCHDASGFDQVADEDFDHYSWTGFALDGAHAQEACESCHRPAAEPNELGRVFGRIAELQGEHFGIESRACSDCHQDPHAGGFDGQDQAGQIDGRRGCLRCHETSSFRTLPHGFEHGDWTAYALEGAHQELACDACHAPLRGAQTSGRTWDLARGTACQDCHADPHGSQFERGGKTDCASCHRNPRTFAMRIFNHDRTRFPLEENHEQVACGACHKAESSLVDGVTINLVRYSPLGLRCVDCHGDQRGGARRRRRGGR